MTVAILEGVTLFAAVCGTIFLWGHYPVLDWLDVMAVLGRAAALSSCCIVAFYYNDLYDLRVVRSLSEFARRMIQSFGVALILLAGFYLLFPDARIVNGAFLSSMLLIAGILVIVRAIGYGIMRHHAFADRVLILGTGPLARKLIEEIEARPHMGYEIVGVADDGQAENTPPVGYPVLGPLAHLTKIAEEVRADRIIVALRERRGRLPMSQLLEAEARGILVEDGLATYEYFTRKLALESLTPSVLIFSDSFSKTPLQLALRRIVSLVVAAAGIVLTAPLMALIALAIKLDSRGPVLFVHDRVGLRGRHFKLLKFRTMLDSEGPTSEWVRDNEERITSVGRWLRAFRLDELPQFLNILRGDMNLIGPRPHPVSNYAFFADQIPYYVLRASVRPGVTGWAQIRYGYANSLEEEIEKMRYDLYYIKHLSLCFDLRILVDTVKIVLFGRGSTAPDAYPLDVRADDAQEALSREVGGSREQLASGASRSQSTGWLDADAHRVLLHPDDSHAVQSKTDSLIGAFMALTPQLGEAGELDSRDASRKRAGRKAPGVDDAARGPASGRQMSSLLTFDIEEWFQTENLRPVFPRANWEGVQRRVIGATQVILDLLAERQLRVTFFILGWVAEREPALVKEIVGRGHEIAAHGYGHVLPMQLTSMEFRDDVLRARKVLEDITGKPVVGYRAPSFSLNHEHLKILAECGYRYDSSFHPFTLHDRYARLDNLGTPLRPGVYPTNGHITELALPVERFGQFQLPISGGGYFRLYPGALFRQLVRRAIVRDGHYIMYLHSWEFDPDMPRVKVPGFGSRFRHYNNLSLTLSRMRELIGMLVSMGASFLTMNEFLDDLDRGRRRD